MAMFKALGKEGRQGPQPQTGRHRDHNTATFFFFALENKTNQMKQHDVMSHFFPTSKNQVSFFFICKCIQ